MRIERVCLRDFLAVGGQCVEVGGPTLLYGPNGAGKSSLILGVAALLYAISGGVLRGLVPDNLALWVRRGAEAGAVEAVVDGRRYRLEIGRDTSVWVDNEKQGYPPFKLIEARVAYVGPCTAAWESWRFHLCEGADLEVEDPEDAEWLRRVGAVAGVEDVYGGRVKVGGRWIDVQTLAYGYRRALAMLIAARRADVLLVEAFEAGLHYDLAVDLIQVLKETSALVIAESHLMATLKAALDAGWRVYYVDGGVFHPIKDVFDVAKYAERERLAYAAISRT
ncbi:AAA family ATPase [Pyrobaculum calidifontis]|uniref:Rad50/SbcC-type AAA domain-containing protein n=1 Tax=Pyrobaculum calidifontis (strain DSM 21063 / JCM 11548 / VA1) TaxID=410359 RepID=A3MSU9_PYRCJ|nr:ATP-binding protein [Pyrobaculum calidifontis]ABO07716.1 conserved hypothetical protein [Pyrobaculum calidifontis JCM 11548]